MEIQHFISAVFIAYGHKAQSYSELWPTHIEVANEVQENLVSVISHVHSYVTRNFPISVIERNRIATGLGNVLCSLHYLQYITDVSQDSVSELEDAVILLAREVVIHARHFTRH